MGGDARRGKRGRGARDRDAGGMGIDEAGPGPGGFGGMLGFGGNALDADEDEEMGRGGVRGGGQKEKKEEPVVPTFQYVQKHLFDLEVVARDGSPQRGGAQLFGGAGNVLGGDGGRGSSESDDNVPRCK